MINKEDVLSIPGKKKKKKKLKDIHTESNMSEESRKSEQGEGTAIVFPKKKKKKKFISSETGQIPPVKEKSITSPESDGIVKKKKKKKKLISSETGHPVKKKKKKKKLLPGETGEVTAVKIKATVAPHDAKIASVKKKKIISRETAEVPSVKDKKNISSGEEVPVKKKKKKKKSVSYETAEESSLKDKSGKEPVRKKKKKKKLISSEDVYDVPGKKKKKKKARFSVKSEDEIFDDLIIQSDREEFTDFPGESENFLSPFSPKEEEAFPIELLDMLGDEDEPPPEIDDDRIPKGGFFGVSPEPSDKEEIEDELLPQFFLEAAEPEEEKVPVTPEKNIEELLKENYGEINDFVEVLPTDDLRATFKPPVEPLPDKKPADDNNQKVVIVKKKKKIKK